MSVFSATASVPLPASHYLLAPSKPSANSFTIYTCKTVSKQSTLTPFRMNTYQKQGGGGHPTTLRSGLVPRHDERPTANGKPLGFTDHWSLISGHSRSLLVPRYLP